MILAGRRFKKPCRKQWGFLPILSTENWSNYLWRGISNWPVLPCFLAAMKMKEGKASLQRELICLSLFKRTMLRLLTNQSCQKILTQFCIVLMKFKEIKNWQIHKPSSDKKDKIFYTLVLFCFDFINPWRGVWIEEMVFIEMTIDENAKIISVG